MKKCLYLTSIICLALFFLGCRAKETTYEKPLASVVVQPVQRYEAAQGSRYSANINPNKRVELFFKCSGYVEEILQVRSADGRLVSVDEGDHVAKATVLARVRAKDYKAKVEQAQAQLSEAKASLAQARLHYDRLLALFKNHSITKPEYDDAMAKLDMAIAKEAQAGAALREAKIALEDCALRSPDDYVVFKRNVEVGTLTGGNTAAFILGDPSSVKAVFGVSDLTVQGLKKGDPVVITIDVYQGVEFPGKITLIAPSADQESRVFNVEVTIANPDNRLKAGMIASLVLEGDNKTAVPSVLVVPLSAIVKPEGQDGYAVFVVQEHAGKNITHRRNVKLGKVYGNTIAVHEGLKADEKVVVIGAHLLSEGQQVLVIPQENIYGP